MQLDDGTVLAELKGQCPVCGNYVYQLFTVREFEVGHAPDDDGLEVMPRVCEKCHAKRAKI
jgi:hypothetical protein